MKKITRFLCFVWMLVLSMMLCIPAFAAEEDTGFSDVAANAWYADSVKFVRDRGLMNGTSTTTFSPEADTSRAMLAAILYRASGSPAVTNNMSFSDVSPDAYYANAVTWASENNIVSGYGNGCFGSNDPVTREQIATILWRYAGSPDVGAAQDFVDESQISVYAMDAVDWARANGIINGMSGNRFAPKNHVTRAQVATILRNYLTMNQHQPEQPNDGTGGKALVAYFSRAGENYNEEMRYYSIDIQNLSAEAQDDVVAVHHTSVIDARIYGSRGTWTLTGDSYYANRNGRWVRVNKPVA